MIKTIELITDFNGLVLFDPALLKEFIGKPIEEGENLFEQFMSTELGDAVLQEGIILPILAIDDGGYEVNILCNESIERPDSDIVFVKETFPLEVKKNLIISDLVVLRDWSDDIGWIRTEVKPGRYSVCVKGFCQKDSNGHISNCGYDISLEEVDVLPQLTADMKSSNKVMLL